MRRSADAMTECARLTVLGTEPSSIAAQLGVSLRTVYRWLTLQTSHTLLPPPKSLSGYKLQAAGAGVASRSTRFKFSVSKLKFILLSRKLYDCDREPPLVDFQRPKGYLRSVVDIVFA